MSKRQRFVISTFLITIILIAATVVDLKWRYYAIGALAILPGILTAWSLWEAWKGIIRLTTVILPMMFGAGAGMFTFLLPNVVTDFSILNWSLETGTIIGWILKFIFWAIFAISYYALLLTENIYSVSAIRTIALARSANAVGFLLTLITGFFLYNAVWSFRMPFIVNGIYIATITFGLLIQGLWSTKMAEKISFHVLLASLVLSLIIGQAAMVISFWPVSVAVGSLVTTTLLYVFLGLYQQELLKRLFRRTIWEYVSVGIAVLSIVTLTTHWG